MIDLNLDGLTDAQKRLFAVRCARRVQHLMQDPRSVAALDVAERYALGQATDAELKEARAEAWAAAEDAGAGGDAAWLAAYAAWVVASDEAIDAASAAARAAKAAEREVQAKMLEEIREMNT